jgi:hypothetical protein
MMHPHPPQPPSGSVDSLLAHSKKLWAEFTAVSHRYVQTVDKSAAQSLHELGALHKKLHGLATDLNSNVLSQQNAGLLEAISCFDDKFEKIDVFQLENSPSLRSEILSKARITALDRLQTVDSTIANKLEKMTPKIPVKPAQVAVDELEKAPNVVSRQFFSKAEQFNNYIESKTTSGKLAIGAAGIVLGGVLLSSGGKWLSHGLDGREPETARIADGSVIVTTKPMNPTKRVAAILGGVVAGATGIAAEIAGFFSLYKSFGM